MHPQTQMICPGCRRFVWDRAPTLPKTRCSACSRTAQVVGPLFRVGKGVPHPGQIAPQTLGVGFILLAAVGVHKGQLLAGAVLQQGMDLVAKGQLAVDLRRRDGHSLSQSRFLRVSAWQDL